MGFLDVLLALITWERLGDIWSQPRGLDVSHLPTEIETQEAINRRNAVMCWHCRDKVWWSAGGSIWLHASNGSPTGPTPDDGYGPYPPHVAKPDTDYPGFFSFDAGIRAINYKYSSRRRKERG